MASALSDGQGKTVPLDEEDGLTQAISDEALVDRSGEEQATGVRTIGEYDLLEEIAPGGMGIVYKAKHRTLGHVVALKLLLAGELATPQQIERFIREAKATAHLSHPNIVGLRDFGTSTTGQHYFTMDFVEGGDLRRAIAQGNIPPRRSATLIRACAEAIQYAHEQGVIHRDLKPGNILLTKDGAPRITDFGVAKLSEGSEALQISKSGTVMGTLAYMPPEQAAGRLHDVDGRSDVYGLGAVLYELLTGRQPFVADSQLRLYLSIAREDPIPPRRLNPAVPFELQTICLKCLEKGRPRRYQTAAALAEDLRRFLADEPILAQPTGPITHARKFVLRHKALTAGTAAVILALSVGLAIALYQWRRAEVERQRAETENYLNSIALAGSKLGDGRIDEAVALLEAAPPHLRHWEWGRLLHTCNLDHLVLKNHTGPVYCSAFSPDGRRLLSGSGDKTAKLWDVGTGKELCTLSGHTDRVSSVAFSPDGNQAVTTSGDKTAKVWDLSSRRITCTLPAQGDLLFCAQFSPEGQLVLTLCRNNTAILWNAKTGEIIRILKFAHDDMVTSATFSLDARQIITASQDGTAKLWDLGTGNLIWTIDHRYGGWMNTFTFATFSKDGQWILTGGGFMAKLWDAKTRELKYTLQTDGQIFGVAISPDSRLLLFNTAADHAFVWDWKRETRIRTLQHPTTGSVFSVTLSPDGKRVATTGQDETVRIWYLEPSRIAYPIHHGGEYIWSLSFSWDCRWLLTGSQDGTAKLWDTASRTLVHTYRHGKPVMRVAFTPDERHLLKGSFDSKSPESTSSLWDIQSESPVSTVTHGKCATMAFSPDGKSVLTGSTDKTPTALWDMGTGKQVLALDPPGDWTYSVTFSPDGRWAATGGTKAVLWDLEKGAPLRTFVDNAPGSSSIINLQRRIYLYLAAFSPDGRRLLTSNSEGAIDLWECESGKRLFTWKERCSSFAFTPDGRRLAGRSRDLLRLWDTETGRKVLVVDGCSGSAYCTVFSPDGRLIATDGQGGNAVLYPALDWRPKPERLTRPAFKGKP